LIQAFNESLAHIDGGHCDVPLRRLPEFSGAADGGPSAQHDAQALVPEGKAIAKLGTRQHRAAGQKIKDLLLETASPFRAALGDDLQMGRLRAGPEDGHTPCRREPAKNAAI
jgi:hypothetical protein